MKNVLKVVLGFVVCFTTLIGFSSNELKNIVVTNIKKGHELIVKNEAGRIVYKEVATANGEFKSDFDFTDLNDGVYTLEVNKDTAIDIQKFKVTNHNVTYIEEAKLFKPIVRLNNDRLYVSQLALNSARSMNVTIFYEDELIKSETVNGGQILNRVYHLGEDVSGTYTVVVKANNRKFKQSFIN